MAAKWLKDTVFYEIYPQSFKDTNGDGIGDINGIIEKLDYIKSLGCNALWINPCFDSPFKDAGYDVRDYKKVAPRYGTNEDLYSLFDQAHKKGIRVLLDLVPGHTSEEHPWFVESQKVEKNEFSDRFIWTDFCFHGADGLPYVGGESERSGCYILNFFKCQPALNYGFYKVTEPWQKSFRDPAAIATREALKDIMRFWLSHGCDGFRVDMASSLVKNDDEKKTGTSAIWKDVRRMLDLEFPDAAMVAEWSNPSLSLRCGYDMDFVLNEHGGGYSTLMRDYYNHGGNVNGDRNAEDHSYFKKDAGGDINREGKASDLYLPVDSSADAPTVAAQEKDPASLLNTVRAILALRHQEEDLQADAAFKVVCSEAGKPFVYMRGDLLCAVNPAGNEQSVVLPASVAEKLSGSALFELGKAFLDYGVLTVGAQSFVVMK